MQNSPYEIREFDALSELNLSFLPCLFCEVPGFFSRDGIDFCSYAFGSGWCLAFDPATFLQ